MIESVEGHGMGDDLGEIVARDAEVVYVFC